MGQQCACSAKLLDAQKDIVGNIIVTTSQVEMMSELAAALIDHLTPKEPLNEFNKADQIPAMQPLSSNKTAI